MVEWDGYSPTENTTFTPITAAGGLSGTFLSQILPSAAYSTAYKANSLDVLYGTTTTEPPDIPLPPITTILPETPPPFVEQFLTLAQAGLVDLIGVGIPEEIVSHIVRMNFTEHFGFAHTAGDQLGDLGAKIEDENFLVSHFQSLE